MSPTARATTCIGVRVRSKGVTQSIFSRPYTALQTCNTAPEVQRGGRDTEEERETADKETMERFRVQGLGFRTKRRLSESRPQPRRDESWTFAASAPSTRACVVPLPLPPHPPVLLPPLLPFLSCTQTHPHPCTHARMDGRMRIHEDGRSKGSNGQGRQERGGGSRGRIAPKSSRCCSFPSSPPKSPRASTPATCSALPRIARVLYRIKTDKKTKLISINPCLLQSTCRLT